MLHIVVVFIALHKYEDALLEQIFHPVGNLSPHLLIGVNRSKMTNQHMLLLYVLKQDEESVRTDNSGRKVTQYLYISSIKSRIFIDYN